MSSELNSRPVDPLQTTADSGNWEVLGILWRRKSILLLMTAVGMGLGYLYFIKATPVYRSVAQVLVVKESTTIPMEDRMIEMSSGYDETHQTVIRSPVVVGMAVSKPEISDLPSLRGARDKAGLIMNGLRATGGGRQTGHIVKLEYDGLVAEDCPLILDAVLKSYQEFLDSSHKIENKQTLDLIISARQALDEDLRVKKREYSNFLKEKRERNALTSTSKVSNESWLQKVHDELATTKLSNSQLEAQIKAIQDALERGGSREALNLMVGKLSSSENGAEITGQKSLEERIIPLLLQEQEMLEKHNFGPDHPQVRMIRKNIQLTRELLLGAKPDGETTVKPADFYEIYLESLREKVNINRQVIASLEQMLKAEIENSQTVTEDRLQEENLRSEISQKERLFEVVLKRLEELNIVKEAKGDRMSVIYPPSVAARVRPDLATSFGAAGILGLVFGLGLAYLVDAADRRFRSPEEIRNEFGLPIFGHIPVITEAIAKKTARNGRERGEVGKLSPSLTVFHQPKGRNAESYRGVRTALFFSTRINQHKVIQVTSPSPGDGKTTLICNLAVSIADAGKRVLLIDADFRLPRVHQVFGLPATTGMSSVIEGNVELTDAIRDTGVPNLYVLPCGPRPANPAELLASKRFEELLAFLREKFEYVLIDSPPVLAVTDPLNVAPRVDGLLLVMRLTKTARHNGRRALEAIEDIGANLLGVVVNGVGKTSGYGYGYGYSYGGGGYSRSGYGRSYGSDYTYGYGDDKSYYHDEETKAAVVIEPAQKRRGNGHA